MTTTVPDWMLGLAGARLKGDPHQRDGQHLRIMPSPIAGLPLTPFAISTVEIPFNEKDMIRRGWIIRWSDAAGNTLTPPFELTPGQPVFGHLPRRGVFVHLRIAEREAEPDTPPLIDWRRGFERIPDLRDGRFGGRFGTPERFDRFDRLEDIFDRFRDPPQTQAYLPLRMSIFGSGLDPDVELAATTSGPWQLTGQGIRTVRVEGAGQVVSGVFVPQDLLDGGGPRDRAGTRWSDPEHWSLPVAPADRYAPLNDAARLAEARVLAQAGLRVPLQEAPGTAPALAPARTAAKALSRARKAFAGLSADMDALLRGGPVPPALRLRSVPFEDTTTGRADPGAGRRSFDLPSLALVLQGSLDPDLGRLLGVLGLLKGGTPGHVTLVRVRCVLPWDGAVLGRLHAQDPEAGFDMLGLEVPRQGLFGTMADLIASLADDPVLRDCAARLDPGTVLPAFDAAAYVAIAPLAPNAPPEAPAEPRAPAGRWRPGTRHPDPRQSLHVSARLGDPALAALARDDGAGWDSLSPEFAPGTGFRAMLTGDPQAGGAPGAPPRLRFFDEDAPARPRYGLAACNLFGQWSGWAQTVGGTPPFPRPPAPQITLDVAHAGPDSPTLGHLLVTVEPPTRDTIPPGGAPVTRLRLRVTQDGRTRNYTQATSLADWNTPRFALDWPAGAQGVVTVTGTFEDARATSSGETRVQRTLADSRPPEPVVIPARVDFAARPDALGLARYAMDWPAAARADTYRVYFAEESALLGVMERDPAHAATAADIRAQQDLARRAETFLRHASRLPRNAFDIAAQPDGPAVQVTVGGGLEGLSLLKIVPVTANGVEGDFARAPLRPFGVPNGDAPPVPNVTARALAGPGPAFEVTVEVPSTNLPVHSVQLRRSQGTADPAARSVVAVIDSFDRQEDGTLRARITDRGPLARAPNLHLAPFTPYAWAAEVRAGPRAAGGPPGEWSDPGPAATALWVPDGPPPPVRALSAQPMPGDRVKLAFTWEGDDDAGTMGSYGVDIYVRAGDGPERLLRTLDIGLRNPATGRTALTLEGVPPGARLRVVVSDPIGRLSPVAATLVEPLP